MLARLTLAWTAWHGARRRLRTFLHDKKAATAIEYGLIASAIAVTIIAAIFVVGNTLSEFFNGISDNIDNAGG